MKKIYKLFIAVALVFIMTGCGNKNVEGTLEEIMTKVYAGIKEDELPMGLANEKLTKENATKYIGTDEIEFKEGLASESPIGSIAHSIVLLRVDDNADVEQIKEKLKTTVDPRKWVCVGVEKVDIESKGNLIIVILSDDLGERIKTNFENL